MDFKSLLIALAAFIISSSPVSAGPVLDIIKYGDNEEAGHQVTICRIDVAIPYKNLAIHTFPERDDHIDFFGHVALSAALQIELPSSLEKYEQHLQSIARLTLQEEYKKANIEFQQLVTELGTLTEHYSLNELNQRLTLMTMKKVIPYVVFKGRQLQRSIQAVKRLQEDQQALDHLKNKLEQISSQESLTWEEQITEVEKNLQAVNKSLKQELQKQGQLYLELQMAAQMESRYFYPLANAAKQRHDLAAKLVQ